VSRSVLDASAVLALLNQERGSATVAAAITGGAAVGTVNLAEVVGKLADAGMPEHAIRAALGGLGLAVVPFDDALCYRAGLLRPSTRAAGLSLGDRACLALAEHLSLPALTADQGWVGVVPGIDVRPIR
jgi:ribonuclease VapC